MKKKNNAIIILNYNDSQTVIDYVNLIKDYKSIDKILIVDNCSTDNSYEILKELETNNIEVIKSNANKGYAYGNNYGVHYLESKNELYNYITISNPDIYIEDNTINKCIDFLNKHDDVAIATPKMYLINDEESPLIGWKERKLNSDIKDSSNWLERDDNKKHIEKYDKDYFQGEYSFVDCVPGSFFIIKYDDFKKVNYFDENTFLYYEEDILGKKIKNIGKKEVVLNNFESLSINKSFNSIKKYKQMQKSKKYYHLTYNEELNKGRRYKIFKLNLATCIGVIEIMFKNSRIYKTFQNIKYEGFTSFFTKILLYFLIVILLPIRLIIRKFRKRKKVCYFSLVTWKWIKQRPHFVALKLCDKYKVHYRYLDLKDKYKKDNNSNTLVKNDTTNPNLKIKPYFIYPGDKKYKFKRGLANLKLLLFNYDTFIYTQPNQIDTIFLKALKLNKTKIYYECMDNYIGWEENKVFYEFKERNLINCSKKVFVSAQKLLNSISDKYGCDKSKFILVRNGYDYDLFSNYKSSKVELKRPCATYIGTIDNWFDLKNIKAYAKKHPDIYFNIVGPINPSIKEDIDAIKEKNIIIHGPIEHSLVPSYIENSDIMLMPFIINEIIEYVDPVKVYEYLFLKKNIVSSYWDELNQFNGLIYYYHNDAEFEKAMDEAIKNKFKENKQYKNIINDAKWDNRLQIYIDTLEEK